MRTQHGPQLIACCLAFCLAAPRLATAGISGPYAVDINTMHLWHLDELTTPAADQAHYNYAGAFTTKADSNQPLNALIGNSVGGAHFATLGNPSYSAAFGTGLSTASVTGAPPYPTNSIEPGLAALTPVNGTADNADHTFDNPTTHAFTMEAIIKFTLTPTTLWSQPQEIIAGEGDAADSSDRSWQFRLEAHTVAENPWVLRFQKVSGFGGAGGSTANFNLDANIPTTGVDALVQNGWYHVAVTYNGILDDPASLKLYWTKMDPSNTQAALVNSGNMNGWLRQQDTDFAIGNEMRDFNGNTEPYAGSIDEVRISDIERLPTQFLFNAAAADNANFDGVGGVNGADYLIWQRGLGLTGAAATLAAGNANGDTVIDAADLAVWKSQFGTGAVTAIPESSTFALACFGVALLAFAERLSRFPKNKTCVVMARD